MKEFLQHLLITITMTTLLLFSFLIFIASEGHGESLSFKLTIPTPVVPSIIPYTKSSEDILIVNPKRLVKMVGTVGPGFVGATVKLFDLANTSQEPIYIQLNGPGGKNIYMNRILQTLETIKARGIEVHCFVPSLAASAHFNILTLGCSHRYAFTYTELMFHDSRISPFQVPNGTEEVLGKAFGRLQEMNILMFAALCKEMKGPEADCTELEQAFRKEKTWKAPDLVKATRPGFLKILKDIRGVDAKIFTGGLDGGLLDE